MTEKSKKKRKVDDEEKVPNKAQKTTNKSFSNGIVNNEPENEFDGNKNRKKKEKREKDLHEIPDAENSINDVEKKHKKHKKNKTKNESENSDVDVTVKKKSFKNEELTSVKHKEHKNKTKNELETSDNEVTVKKKKIKEIENEDLTSELDTNDIPKRKKKKRKHVSQEVTSDVETVSPSKKLKKSKGSKDREQNGNAKKSVEKNNCSSDEDKINTKIRKKKSDEKKGCDEQLNSGESKKKKKKKKGRPPPSSDEEEEEKLEIEITKSKKKKCKKSKIREDTIADKTQTESEPKKSENIKDPVKLGQWSTVSFDDQKRQDKFQRLLGGFKKDSGKPKSGLYGGLTARVSGNNALDRAGQDELNKNLQAQYDSALSIKLGATKGLGLGFQPPPGAGKKFYIDTGKSSSVKFDD
ncbi:hypothetical protein SNE40_012629 [Patella caerulea]|uniref:Small acidic protein-like domain-containing protein n=1 Tax=Patella caerulea TaxID=87958 RepID=A0AAN8JS07_PATCE